LTDIVELIYPTPGHFEKISQLSISDDFGGVAEIDVIAAAVASQIEDIVEDRPTFHVVTLQIVINPHHPPFFEF
jgi:hypothetical protein